ncbi:hypothetical protein NE237_009259 [Protea cynaroides]|uniref:Uncharacterized protein n=1 Tax=Protea cynaroides TaxID=273540 RepID=A0A9Q0R0G5_9MAGN|nr:hypothetical protein NE237_009259 [Protea cynaroides]
MSSGDSESWVLGRVTSMSSDGYRPLAPGAGVIGGDKGYGRGSGVPINLNALRMNEMKDRDSLFYLYRFSITNVLDGFSGDTARNTRVPETAALSVSGFAAPSLQSNMLLGDVWPLSHVQIPIQSESVSVMADVVHPVGVVEGGRNTPLTGGSTVMKLSG